MQQKRGYNPRGMRPALIAVLAIWLTGCQYSEDRHLKRNVKAEELAGHWQATESAIESLREIGITERLSVASHQLHLSTDGTCRLRTFVNVPIPEPPDYQEYDSGCKWRILGDAPLQNLQFDLAPVPARAPYYYFGEESGKLLLWQYVADPDAWLYIEFEKVAAR